MKKVKIELPYYKCLSWNILYAGRHWTKRQEMADDAKSNVIVAILKDNPFLKFDEPVSIIITAYLKRMIDCDNVCSKLLIDGLKECKVIKDDSPKYVRSVKTRVVKSKTDHTEIEIFIDPTPYC